MSSHYGRLPGGEEAIAARITPLSSEEWRRIQASMRRRVSGVFSSQKMNCPLPWRKPAERDLLSLLETDPVVDSIEVLPHQVTLIVEGKTRHHFPGFKVCSGHRVAIMDALSSKEAADLGRAELTKMLAAIYAKRGLRYAAVPQSEISLEPRFGNVRFILRHRGFAIDLETQRLIVETLSTLQSSTITALRERLAPRPYVSETVCVMTLARKLRLDLSAHCPSAMTVSLSVLDAA